MHSFTTYATVPDALSATAPELTRIFTESAGIGFQAARLVVPWNAVHTADNTYSWTALDRAVNAAVSATTIEGTPMRVMLTLAPPNPAFVVDTKTWPVQFGAFAGAVADRYRPGGAGIATSGRGVTEYQIWDEPNAFSERLVQPSRNARARTPATGANDYVALLRAANVAIKKIHPQAVIVFAGLRATVPSKTSGVFVDPVAFLSGCYSSMVKGLFDVMAYHPLSMPTAQFSVPPAPSAKIFAQSDELRQLMVSKGDAAIKMYWTQVGYHASSVTATQQRLYLDTVRWFAQERRDYVAAIALDYRDSANRPAGLVSADFTARPARAQVSRWHDGVRRHTLFTACGTNQDGWGLVSTRMNTTERNALLAYYQSVGGPSPTPGEHPGDFRSPDTIMGTRANPARFNWVPVSYPASWPASGSPLDNGWQPSNITFEQSITAGVEEMSRLIAATPGTFALSGMSQGSMVISLVLKQLLPGGKLAHRYADCIGAVAFGNPMRRQGASFPGGTAPSGAGLFASAIPGKPMLSGLGNVTTPDWWWELCTPGDVVSDGPMNTAAAAVITSAVNAFATSKGVGTGDPISLIMEIASKLAARDFVSAIPAVRVLLATIARTAIPVPIPFFGSPAATALNSWITRLSTTAVNPHVLYNVWSPPSLPSGLGLSPGANYIDVGAAYLNARGASVAPR